jgi:uncharacterized protein
MKIGVISDTHIPVFSKDLPAAVREAFLTCDLIVHAGDSIERSAIQMLRDITETKAVKGNMDSEDLKRDLPESIVFDCAGKKIGVTHGKGSGSKILDFVKKSFNQKLDVIIFGHSHTSFNQLIDGTLFFNPGSATDNVFSGRRTFGIIEINGDDVRGEIIEIK